MSSNNQSGSSKVSKASSKASNSNAAAASSNSNGNVISELISKTTLRQIIAEVGTTEHIFDEDAENIMLELVEDFVLDTIEGACRFAKLRKGNTLETKDIQMHLGKAYNLWIPGYGSEEIKPYKRPQITEAHKHRMAALKKNIRNK